LRSIASLDVRKEYACARRFFARLASEIFLSSLKIKFFNKLLVKSVDIKQNMADGATTQAQRNKMMLGFIVRRCARDIGHPPTPEEFAEWANNQGDNGERYSLFGRPISPSAASIILRHPGRLVTARLEAIVRGLR